MNTLIIETRNKIATITINRPEKLNALNLEVLTELSQCLEKLENDPNIRVLIITGSGTKAFVAGADIKELANLSPKEGEELAREGQRKVFDTIENYSKPVIAAINGYALGGGLELAMACHIRLASDTAMLGLPEVSLGLIPGYGGTQRLPKLIGKGRAMQLILSGKALNANKAYEFGLVNSIESPEILLVEAQNLAEQIMENAPMALNYAIQATNAFNEGDKGFAKEQKLFGELFQTSNFKEGISAFLEKRKPTF